MYAFEHGQPDRQTRRPINRIHRVLYKMPRYRAERRHHFRRTSLTLGGIGALVV